MFVMRVAPGSFTLAGCLLSVLYLSDVEGDARCAAEGGHKVGRHNIVSLDAERKHSLRGDHRDDVDAARNRVGKSDDLARVGQVVDGDDAAVYRLKVERAARVADERMRATRERVERDVQERLSAVRERVERGARERFGSNYSEFPNSSRRRDASRRWDDSRGDVSPGNKPIVFMAEDEMVELASSPGLSYKDQNSLAVFGGERVHMALAGRDDLCDDAQMALVVHGDGRAQVALARRRSLSESVQVALAVHGDFAARRALSRRFDLCNHARRVLS